MEGLEEKQKETEALIVTLHSMFRLHNVAVNAVSGTSCNSFSRIRTRARSAGKS